MQYQLTLYAIDRAYACMHDVTFVNHAHDACKSVMAIGYNYYVAISDAVNYVPILITQILTI